MKTTHRLKRGVALAVSFAAIWIASPIGIQGASPASADVLGTQCSVPPGYTYNQVRLELGRCSTSGFAPVYNIVAPADNIAACTVPDGFTYSIVRNELARCSTSGFAPTYNIRVPADNISACTVPDGFTYDIVRNELARCAASGFAPTYNIRVPADNMSACTVPPGFTYDNVRNELARCSTSGFAPTYNIRSINPPPTPTTTTTTTTPPPITLPTLQVFRNPSTMVANQSYTIGWSSTNATRVSYNCTAPGTGYNSQGEQFVGNVNQPDPFTGIAEPGWVGNPSRCVWTAYGADGRSTTLIETLTTVDALPTLQVFRNPRPMIADESYTIGWSSTNATRVSYNCTAAGTGYNSQGEQFVGNVNQPDPFTGIAEPGWVGFPSRCVWTAYGANGSKTTVIEILRTTGESPEPPGIQR